LRMISFSVARVSVIVASASSACTSAVWLSTPLSSSSRYCPSESPRSTRHLMPVDPESFERNLVRHPLLGMVPGRGEGAGFYPHDAGMVTPAGKLRWRRTRTLARAGDGRAAVRGSHGHDLDQDLQRPSALFERARRGKRQPRSSGLPLAISTRRRRPERRPVGLVIRTVLALGG
jgi:hypothetical protein